jgi:hypothetical protein
MKKYNFKKDLIKLFVCILVLGLIFVFVISLKYEYPDNKRWPDDTLNTGELNDLQ